METFASFLNEKLKEKGITLSRLSELTNISIKHLENLSQGNPDKLPPKPYLRGYLIKIGNVLGFNGEECWNYFKDKDAVFRSEEKDELPKNRFATKPVYKKVWLIGLVVLIGIYLLIRLPYIIGKPVIVILSPQEEIERTTEESFLLRGRVQNGDTVFINGENVPLSRGIFEKSISLEPGINTVEVVALKFLGRKAKTVRTIIFEPPAESLPPASRN